MASNGAADQPSVRDIAEQLKQLKERMDGLEKENANLRALNTSLTAKLAQMREKLGQAEDGQEKLRRKLNATRLCVKGAAPGTNPDEIKAKITEVAGLRDHAIVEVYSSGPTFIVVFAVLADCIRALKAQNMIWQASGKQWRLDRSLTKQQREARAAMGPRYLELKAQGAFPRWHGTELMVRTRQGIVPEQDWRQEDRVVLPPPPQPAPLGGSSNRHTPRRRAAQDPLGPQVRPKDAVELGTPLPLQVPPWILLFLT